MTRSGDARRPGDATARDAASGLRRAPPAARGTSLRLAGVLLAILLVAGGLTPVPPRVFVLDAGLLLLAYGVPAWWIHRPRRVLRGGWLLLGWVLPLTLAWDATSAGLGGRTCLSEWWLVYPSSVAFFAVLYLVHAWIVHAITTRARPRTARPSSPP
ncbi:MAG TPA: hypothetical protein VJ957_00935 [Longimicrobiales bacterium]|nr:hypothetical protein [Longimicrobiales bacterium]